MSEDESITGSLSLGTLPLANTVHGQDTTTAATQKKRTTKKQYRLKKQTERCCFCNKLDVIESGYYSKDLATKTNNKDDDSEEEYTDFWFCCILHNWMYKHKHGICYMPNSTYNEELKKLNMKRYKNKNKNTNK